MKILVLSLLRIGDIVMTAHALRGLRDGNPDAEIHLMINAQFRQVTPLLPYINKFHLFDRDRLQKGLGDVQTPMFDSFERLQDFVEEVDANEFDLVVNLTHSRLSGWLMSTLRAKDRIGLAFDDQARATFGTNWFRYLNSQVDAEGSEVFHYGDVFKFAMNVGQMSPLREALVETPAGRAEAAVFGGSGEMIAVQPLTSDTKKDWGFSRFVEALSIVQAKRPQAEFAILGAPFEREKLEPLMVALAARGVRARLAILSFEGAYSFLKRCQLILTGDTSIKHLACAAQIPVVELSLGSSDLNRTGAYHHGSLIVRSKEACAPCVHSKPCHRDVHACAKRVSAEAVAMVVGEAIEKRVFQLRAIADEYQDELEIFKVDQRSAGFWVAHSVRESFTEANVGRWIDLTSRKLWLDGTARVDRMGTEIRQLSNLLRSIYPTTSDIEWQNLLEDFERQLGSVEGRVNGFKVGLQYLRGAYDDPKRVHEFVRGLISFRERIRHSALLASFKASLDRVIDDDVSPAFTRFRHMSDLVSEIEQRSALYSKLIRGLSKTSEPEKGVERA